jgi:starvation-inducible outer membrane lipoprotein
MGKIFWICISFTLAGCSSIPRNLTACVVKADNLNCSKNGEPAFTKDFDQAIGMVCMPQEDARTLVEMYLSKGK